MAETINTGALAGPSDLTDRFQPGLLKTPFLLVDEGWPQRKGTGRAPADAFRELVAGGTRFVDRKFQDPLMVTNPVRILFTANNTSVVQMLAGNRDLSPEDREALAIRLLHFDLSDEASEWLKRKGGREKFTRGWIKPDGAGASDYIVAKHFLWLHQNCRRPSASRFLVEGNIHQQIMHEMRTRSGSAPFVVEALIKMVEFKGRRWPGLVFYQDELYVLTSEVLEYYRAHLMARAVERLTSARVGGVLRGLAVRELSEARVLPPRKELGRKRWHVIDCKVLLRAAQEDGWQCPRLQEIVEQGEEGAET